MEPKVRTASIRQTSFGPLINPRAQNRFASIHGMTQHHQPFPRRLRQVEYKYPGPFRGDFEESALDRQQVGNSWSHFVQPDNTSY